MPKFSGYINPFTFLPIEDPFVPTPPEATAEGVLRAATTPGTDGSPKAFQSRCGELASFWGPPIVPDHAQMFDRIVWPLRQAKANYCFGNFVASLGLCGMVCEMITSTYIDASGCTVGNAVPSGKKLDKLGQHEKIEVILAHGIISQQDADALHDVKRTRNEYLHWWSKEHTSIQEDAKRVYGITATQLQKLTFEGFNNGAIVFPPLFRSYLVRHGLLPNT